MSYIPTVEQARELVMRYNKEPFHLQHAETVSKVMGEIAKRYDPDNVEFWAAVGMLHDIDFELWPEQHCVKADALLRELGMDEALIHANDIAVFTAMCMCWSGYLSTHTSMMDSLNCKELIGKAILCHTVGGLCAGIAAHWLFVLFSMIV